jgi:transcriptional regulator with XRE-family HTH domain
MTSRAGFGSKLRWWRKHRGLSQLELPGRAEISQRHLSFLELGRASLSRQMVLRLAEALGIPLRQQNAFLLAAGFAPAWRETQFEAQGIALGNDGFGPIAAGPLWRHHETQQSRSAEEAEVDCDGATIDARLRRRVRRCPEADVNRYFEKGLERTR